MKRTASNICSGRRCRRLRLKTSQRRNVDLWPAVLAARRSSMQRSRGSSGTVAMGLVRWALLAGVLAVIAVAFPASIPLLLYYL